MFINPLVKSLFGYIFRDYYPVSFSDNKAYIKHFIAAVVIFLSATGTIAGS